MNLACFVYCGSSISSISLKFENLVCPSIEKVPSESVPLTSKVISSIRFSLLSMMNLTLVSTDSRAICPKLT